MSVLPTLLDSDACYQALRSHDARFDGLFYTGVTSTGIYCRPVCRVRTPKRENCHFFGLATQAEQAGFRPCLRCRPELAPGNRFWSSQDAASILATQVAHWLDNAHSWDQEHETWPSIAAMAHRLGVSDRHLRRVFSAQMGVSPLQYQLTRKLLTAKQLLADTTLPVSQVALASGFSSLRRFNAAFSGRYRLKPTDIRRHTAPEGNRSVTPHGIHLTWRPPYDAQAMAGFLAQRHIPLVEAVTAHDPLEWRRTVRLFRAGTEHKGWIHLRFQPEASRVELRASDALHQVLPQLIWRVRTWLDLDANPQAINATLHTDFPHGDGLRLPGAFDGFELAVRAILGQQVTVAAASTLTARLVQLTGEPFETSEPGLSRLFPQPSQIARIPAGALAHLGIFRQRQQALIALARAIDQGHLQLDAHSDVATTTQTLLSLPGIGPWTAQYIVMRALHWPDAWPPGDSALAQALGTAAGRASPKDVAQRSAAWHPWRSYAVIRAWAGTLRQP